MVERICHSIVTAIRPSLRSSLLTLPLYITCLTVILLSSPSLQHPLSTASGYIVCPVFSQQLCSIVLLYRFTVVRQRTRLILTSFSSKMLDISFLKRYLKSFMCAKIISSYVLQNISAIVRVYQKIYRNQQIIHVLRQKFTKKKCLYGVMNVRYAFLYPVIHVLQS